MHRNRIVLILTAIVLFYLTGPEKAYSDEFDFLTVGDVVKKVRDNFASLDTYQASFSIVTKQGGSQTRQNGIIRYRATDRMLVEFSHPPGQKIVSDGKTMWIYLPSMNVVAEQGLESRGGFFLAASQSGLNRLFSRYHYRFASKEQPVRQPDGSKLYVLELSQKVSKAGLRQLTLYINEDYFITRAEGQTASGKHMDMTFSNIRTGIDMPKHMFKFDIPARAQIIKDPMLSEE